MKYYLLSEDVIKGVYAHFLNVSNTPEPHKGKQIMAFNESIDDRLAGFQVKDEVIEAINNMGASVPAPATAKEPPAPEAEEVTAAEEKAATPPADEPKEPVGGEDEGVDSPQPDDGSNTAPAADG